MPRFTSMLRGALILTVGCVGALSALYQYQVVQHPEQEVLRAHLRTPSAMAQVQTATSVATEPPGVDTLPTAYVAALVAVEDARFWSHGGFDVMAIGSAMVANVDAGAVVRGGSTLSQQTAKNLFPRTDRSLRSKLVEAVHTLRIEHHLDKEEILVAYANHFYASGQGYGLEFAARRYFDKSIDELDLVESAFLAGMVGAPSTYDPFRDDEGRQTAMERASRRTTYVLQRLLEEDAATLARPGGSPSEQRARIEEVRRYQHQAAELLREPIEVPFRA